jgi:tetratricopeptide (TPR) repeat protein
VQNYGQAIETLRKLVSLYPADTAGYNNLGIAYSYAHNLPEAAAAARRALEISPNNVQTRLNFAETSMQAGDFQTAITESQRILKQNPSYEFAFLPLALSTLAQGEVQGARDAYARLEKLGPQGFSLAKAGQADLEMYLGRYKEALAPLEAGIEADKKEKNDGEMAVKYVARAEAQLASGQRAQSIESAGRAVETSPVESILYFAARVLVHAGDEAKARALGTKLENMLQSQTKSDALLIHGENALEHGRFTEAVESIQSAQKLQDLWISHLLLGRAYTEAGHFAEALAEFDICRKRKGEAVDLFLADMSTIRLLPPLYYWTGRAQEGLGTVDAARASYQEFLRLRTDADAGDPLAADAKRRAAASH